MTSPSAPQRRFAHLWFDRLPTDRLRSAHLASHPASDPGAVPLVVVETCRNALRLAAVDEAAQAEGLTPGMTLADARARLPQVAVAHAEPEADLAFLTRLAEACRRYTPALALHAPDGVDLDITGCGPLFGGEAALFTAIGKRMRKAGLSLRLAFADTPAQAHALARFGGGGVTEPGGGEAALAPLPVAALRLDPQSCEVLRGLGLHRVEQVLRLPRASLARRLGAVALDRLDEALGRRSGPLEVRLERSPFRAERRLFEPVCEPEAVLKIVADLARDLAIKLEGRGLGGRAFELALFRVDGAVKRLDVAVGRPLRAPDRITALYVERLAGLNEGLEADFGFDHLRLTAGIVEASRARGDDLLQASGAGAAPDETALGDLADRIAARSGARISRLRPGDAHAPERADVAAPCQAGAHEKRNWADEAPQRFEETPLRPLRLFRPPQPIEVAAAEAPEGPPAAFTWRRVGRRVVRAEGPERIEPEWSQGGDPTRVRDYFRLEDETGRRYWVFRQGRYSPPPEAETQDEPRPEATVKSYPRWYLHGLFG